MDARLSTHFRIASPLATLCFSILSVILLGDACLSVAQETEATSEGLPMVREARKAPHSPPSGTLAKDPDFSFVKKLVATPPFVQKIGLDLAQAAFLEAAAESVGGARTFSGDAYLAIRSNLLQGDLPEFLEMDDPGRPQESLAAGDDLPELIWQYDQDL